MRRPSLVRPVALVIALLASLSSSAVAVAHGYVHEHLTAVHEGDDHATGHHGVGSDSATIDESSSGEHAHSHPALDAAQVTRELVRLTAASVGPAVVPSPPVIHRMPRVVRAPARTDRVLLARPGPERGPPPTLRAPPAS